jgi:cardiolipin synthase (CMP-forming)
MIEGELWVEELLDQLRRGRFRPAAWLRFFEDSFARARGNRREQVRAHRQVLALGTVGVGTWAGVAASGRPLLGTVAAGWSVLVLLMADWHLGMLERPDGSRLAGLGAANTVTLLRAGAIPVLPVVTPTALGIVVLAAGLSDVADGFVARSRREATRFGAWLDGAIDGILLSVAAGAAAHRALLPAWIAALIVARYLAPWLGIAGVYFVSAHAPGREGFVSGRIPGAVLLVGLVLAAFAVPGAALVAAAGALGGLATVGATIVVGASRSRRARGRAGTAELPPAGLRASSPDRGGSSASGGRQSSASASPARTRG